jgi:hypothetical protein
MSYAQIDQRKLDSLSRAIDSSVKAHQSSEDSFIKLQDNHYHSELNKALQQSKNNLLAEEKREEAEERQQIIVRILIGVLLVAGIIAIVRRSKT